MLCNRRLCTGAVLLAGVTWGSAASLPAQTYFQPPSHEVTWSHYTMPEACREATNRARMRASRDDRSPTFEYNLFDTLPAVVVHAARQCLHQSPVSSVASQSLPVLLELALMARDTAVFDAVIKRQLAEVPGKSHKAHAAVIVSAMMALSRIHPIQVSVAQRYVAMADSLWPNATMERAKLRTGAVLLSRDPEEIARLLRAAQALANAPTDEPLTDVDREELRFLDYGIQYNTILAGILRDGPTDTLMAQMRTVMGGMAGQPLDAITGQFYYPASPSDARVFPVLGKPSLVLMVDYQCGANCLPMYAAAKRMREQFPALPVIVSTTTRGAFRGQLAASALQEAEWIRDYYHNDLKLPVSVLIDTMPHTKRPDPDRRRVTALTETGMRFQQSYERSFAYDMSFYLVDPKGRVVIQNLGGANEGEWMMVKLIKRMLGSPATP